MKRKILISVLAMFSFCLLAVGISACKRFEHKHEFTCTVTYEPTCAIIGECLYSCACGYSYADKIPALGHDWGDWNETLPATCTEKGEETRICMRENSHTETRKTSALGHDWGDWEKEKSASCTETGLLVRTCLRDDAHSETEILERESHNYIRVAMKEPTCAEDGWFAYRICEDCGDTNFQAIPATDHPSRAIYGSINPTCTGSGLSSYWKCLICDYTSPQDILPPLGHSYGDGEILREAGCVYFGEEERICSVCGDSELQCLPMTEHLYSEGCCTVCGRRDWSTAERDDPNLYNADYGFLTFGGEERGAAMQELYLLIDDDARVYHAGDSNADLLNTYDYLSLGLTKNEAIAVWKTYLDDHPLYYWLSRTLTYTVEDISVGIDAAYTDAELRRSYNEFIYETANEWRLAAGENAYLAALAYHDAIIERVDYLPSNAIFPNGTSFAHNIIGAFEGSYAVCEGYARSFQLLLNMTGIENRFVTGSAGEGGEAHAWNIVKLDDGNWYNFDLTYDDSPNWMWGIRYNYFAVTDAQNTAWADGGWTYSQEKAFSENHVPDNGTGVRYLDLPARATTPYAGVGELRLRQTFTVGDFTYALAGDKAVQLVKCTAEGDVKIPAFVEYGGAKYEVVSVGAMRDGLFKDDGASVFEYPKKIMIPATVRFLWGTARSTFGLEAYEVAEDNEYYTSVDGVLFTKSLYTLIAYPSGSPRAEYAIPDGVVQIAHDAFRFVKYLRALEIGRDLDYAGAVNWGNGWPNEPQLSGIVYSIGGEWASIVRCASAYGADFLRITVNEENPYYRIENNMLFDGTALETALASMEEVVIPAFVEYLGHDAFRGCSEIRRVVFEGTALRRIWAAFSTSPHPLLDEIVWPGTRAEWDAVEKADKDWDKTLGTATPDGTYTLICLRDEE